MSRLFPSIALVLMATVAGCAHAVPKWQDEAKSVMSKVSIDGAPKEFPAEYDNTLEILKKAEDLLKEDEVEEADDLFRLAVTKGKLLESDLAALKARRDEETRLRIEAEKQEIARLHALQREAESRTIHEKLEAEDKKGEAKSRHLIEKPLPFHHTVKRGETLPQIAAQSDVYNEYKLWPLLYRANRDQIRDPKHIWPGQVLRIPRNPSREEISEARRYAQEKPIQ
jgi:nucleoid-associated protein YgaU